MGLGLKIAVAPLIAVLTATNILLVCQNRQLRSQLRVHWAALRGPVVGSRVPAIKGIGFDGKPISVSYGHGEKGTILLVFSPKCGLCEANWPKWRSLVEDLDLNQYQAVLVDLAKTLDQSYLKRHPIKYSHFIGVVDLGSRLLYGLRGGPTTIVVDPNGRVKGDWVGALAPESIQEVKHALFGFQKEAKPNV